MAKREWPRGAGTAADQATVRRHNLSVVLSHLQASGPRSRARVAEETGLNKATVSSLVTELVARGLVAEGEAERGAVGRPGQAIGLDGSRVFAIGAEVNVDFVAAAAISLRGEVVSEKRIALDTAGLAPEAVLGRLAELILAVRAEVPSRAVPAGLCIAVPGLVESATGVLTVAPNLGWTSVPVIDMISERIGEPECPVRLDNEANLAALAETNQRGVGGSRSLVLLTGAAGIGGGVVNDSRLLRGGAGFAGEVGHMRLDPGGARCGCGRRGCWETVIGLNALLGRAADADDPVRNPALDVEQRLAELNSRAEAGDERTLRALAETGTWLGAGAAILANVLNPEVLVLGGYFATLGRWFLAPLREELAAQVFAPDAGGCRVELSTLGFSAAVRGGSQSMLESVFADPTLIEPVRSEALTVTGGGR